MSPEPFADILDENETLLWTGKPNRRVWMSSGYVWLSIGIVWGILIVLMLFAFIQDVMHNGHSPPLEFLCIMMVLVPLFHGSPCWGSILYMYWLHCAEKKTVYACTDKRVLIKRGGFGVSYITIHYGDIRDVTVRVGWFENRCKTGTLLFETGALQPMLFGIAYWNLKRFTGIETPYVVAKMIDTHMQAAKK